MKDFKERVCEVSSYLQRLMEPDVFPDVSKAIEESDRDLLIKACEKADIPEAYASSIASLLFNISRQLKWPMII